MRSSSFNATVIGALFFEGNKKHMLQIKKHRSRETNRNETYTDGAKTNQKVFTKRLLILVP